MNGKKQTKGLKRNDIDKFYTKNNIAELCINCIQQNVSFQEDDVIIEPSAGNGSFIESIKSLLTNHIFLDLEPENEEIIEQNYLEYDLSNIRQKFKNIHVIGNPPFGRQSSLAIKFIEKSCEFADSISFILPKSFKKESLKRKFPTNYHLIFETDLPQKSFWVNAIEHDVPCVFQIWIKRNYNRNISEKLKPINFLFVKKSENPDISVRRVGVNAGYIDVNIDKKSIQSHYFVKFTNNKSVSENINTVSKIEYEHNNTVGPKSISKQELIYKFNQLLN